MKTIIARLFGDFDSKEIECEVESELRFHLQMLTEEYLLQGLTLKEAEREASKVFGNIEGIKNQCVEIRRNNHLFVRALKCFLTLVFLAGVLTRIFSANIYAEQIGNMLIAISVLSGLLLSLRVLSPARFIPKNKAQLSLELNGNGNLPISLKDQLTPVERVITGK